MERPRVARIAYALCWLSMVMSIPSIVDAIATEGESAGNAQAIYIGFGLLYATILGLGVYVILSIGRARNWARIVYTVLTALSVLAVLGSLQESFQRPWYSWSADLLTTSMDIAIVALLFRPAANEWYRLRGRKPVEPAV